MKDKVAYLGIFTALAMILSYIESLFPLFYGIPGVKLGLANSMSLVILYLLGFPAACRSSASAWATSSWRSPTAPARAR